MDERTRNEIIQRWLGKASQRRIAQELQVARATVRRVLERFERERSSGSPSAELPKPAARSSALDRHEGFLRQLLERYPNMTAVRVHEELRLRGYLGSYTTVRERVRRLRPRPAQKPVVRFETPPGAQAQMDYSSYDIDFTEEGRRRVHLFSYLLGYSRRLYLHFVDCQDFTTTIREHVRAFEYLQGVAATCLYDNLKVVVLQHDADGPIYNPRFLAFATHYGFKPWACLPRRAQTKGKAEKKFDFVEKNLLNGRTFCNLDHLNRVTLWWLANVADVRIHRETKQRPIDRYRAELPHLIALPPQPYDTAVVLYRSVNVEGFVCYQQNYYEAPWRFIGQALPLRITEEEVIVYSPSVEEVVRHRLFPRGVTQQRSENRSCRPPEDSAQQLTLLRERFAELGADARRFLEGLLRDSRYGKSQARKVLALMNTYARKDLIAALERAVRFGAYSVQAVMRILAAQFQPKSVLAMLAEEERRRLQPLLDEPVSPRPLADYQHLLHDGSNHEPASETSAIHVPPSATESSSGAT
ncbi:MAG: IS21 family transposase [Terriglobales bacterium]